MDRRCTEGCKKPIIGVFNFLQIVYRTIYRQALQKKHSVVLYLYICVCKLKCQLFCKVFYILILQCLMCRPLNDCWVLVWTSWSETSVIMRDSWLQSLAPRQIYPICGDEVRWTVPTPSHVDCVGQQIMTLPTQLTNHTYPTPNRPPGKDHCCHHCFYLL